MLVLALDTATPALTVGVVELTTDGATTARAGRVVHDTRRHAEFLLPAVLESCREAGLALRDLEALVVGAGPGPFTGLRVGMVTAAALGDALALPVHGVCSLDAIAHDAIARGAGIAAGEAPGAGGNLLVVTDARRREVYWAAYDAHARRLSGPHVEAPAALAERVDGLHVVAAAGGCAEGLGLPVHGPASPSAAGLVAVAAADLLAGTDPGPLVPLYLRRPDAAEPGARKRVARVTAG
ncbi:MAG TPA: tRNA (adenosine(37)-N6)-threonylcarbamoyltransferase complex dimerization subunit type 1 TsaB [Pseudonocardia sp.]|nr:tRNA (adenosine(37)-N6)-threonylcarbamoyltransferase complex dimerization subunit type 1 TsaB [Pseudonocardia sp.]